MQRRAVLRAGGAVGAAIGIAQATRSLVTGTDRDGFEPLGRVPVTGAAEAVVGDDGETAYLATTDGFATVDIADPSDPTLLEERYPLSVDDERFHHILDVKVDGDRLAVVGPADRTASPVFHGFVIYDVSDPADPVAVGEPYETGYHIHNCFLDGDVLYVVANQDEENPLVVFDVSGDGPTEIGRWSLIDREPEWGEVHWLVRYLHDVYVHDDVAALAHWNAGTYLLDVSDPADPQYISHVRETELETHHDLEREEAQLGLPGNDHYSAVDDTGELLAVGREAWATGGEEPDGPGGIDLYDVSDPADPEKAASIAAPAADDASYRGGEWTTAHNFELRDGRLSSSWYQGGVKIHDVSDPADPEELAHWRDTETAAFWTARIAGPETIVASSTPQVPNAETDGALYTFHRNRQERS
ncbi:hypothetical protein RBH26_09215 [Natronolimnohabitans sp. A-GB9]|uniref:LVIVD repeat-containing protein n=1 Tax=Natronolimnohabitans sp. A-GB9 TaxID=3069757 RepID=UPI0027B3E5C0|nr:hypothetical protein [Natronolimnohabitans sp. A-GB9]MDQ2050667.1 hypothetical protein [Natronolimnohabitans sp. A-GB9]